MSAFVSTPAASRRAPSVVVARAHIPRACLLQLTIDSGALSALRALVARTCGDALQFMRVEACDHGARVRVWLCLSRALAGQVMEAVMRALPGAEFGRLTPLAQRAAR